MQAPPDYLVIGHVAKDLLPGGGVQAGGTATYAAIAAQRLGLQAAIVTALMPEDEALLDPAREAGVWICAITSPHTTTFENVYDEHGRRTQHLRDHAAPIQWSDIPSEWRGASITHLGPIAQELPDDMASYFPYNLLGITPQGWMRSWDAEGLVTHTASPIPASLMSLPSNACLILSMEDLGWDAALLARYAEMAPKVVVTQSHDDAMLFMPSDEVLSYISQGAPNPRGAGQVSNHFQEDTFQFTELLANSRRNTQNSKQHRAEITVPALHASPVDPTGAGDVFAAAFLTRYHETRNPIHAARFAHAAAACAIEAHGVEAIPTREQVISRLEQAS